MKINRTRYSLLFSFIFFIMTTLPAAAFQAISLDGNDWWIRKGFNAEWIQHGTDLRNNLNRAEWSKRRGGTNQRVVDIFPGEENRVETFTFVTFFDAPQEMVESVNSLGLFLPGIGECWQAYINGTLVADEYFLSKDGSISLNRTVRGRLVDFSGTVLKEKENVLAFRITGHTRFWGTGLYLYPGYRIDSSEKLKLEESEYFIFMLLGLYLLSAIYHFILFSRRRKERYNFYYGLMGIFIFAYFISRTSTILNVIPSFELVYRIELLALYSLFPAVMAFIEDLFFARVSRLTKIYAVFCSLLVITTPFVSLTWSFYVVLLWQASALIMLFYVVYLYIKAYRKKVPEVKPLTAAMLILFFTVIYDIIEFTYLSKGYTFSKYAVSVVVMGIAVVLGNKLMRVYNEVEDLNLNLENKVTERTNELQQTLETVESLKQRQDGDYYLTSLLMAPLARNDVSSKNVRVGSVIRQNKTFEFKGKEAEIGGDLNIATTISLQGKKYIAFINSDAMGKSIQGAGGALVTGAIYNAFLNRSMLVSPYKRLFPELWLRDCLMDLHNVFNIFKGSMYTSLCMGLLDEETGFLYYVNAEHPLLVLYHEGKATYLDKDMVLRRVGMEFDEEDIIIKTYQMKPGDILLSGSDGRDDIATGEDEEGNRILNSDVNAFLRHVEAGRGNVEEVFHLIQESGTLTDDLTLLSLAFDPAGSFSHLRFLPREELPDEVKTLLKRAEESSSQGNSSEALSFLRAAKEKSASHCAVLEEIIKVYIRDRKYELAAEIAEQFSDANPHDHELLYLLSYSLKMAGDYSAAVEYGERLRLRKPGIASNLFNLADAYRLAGNPVKAQEILHYGLSIEGDNPHALKLKKVLEQGGG